MVETSNFMSIKPTVEVNREAQTQKIKKNIGKDCKVSQRTRYII